MISKHRQRGLSLWAWLYILSITFVLVATAVKSIPVIMQDVDIHGIMKKVAKDPKSATATPQEIRFSIERYIDTGFGDREASEQVRVKSNPKSGGRMLDLQYQRTVPMFSYGAYTLALSYSFHHKVDLPKP
ncbi:MAG: DUF4845 domain-containing protein [Nevskiales bacterium]